MSFLFPRFPHDTAILAGCMMRIRELEEIGSPRIEEFLGQSSGMSTELLR
jgi:hypothetical protein